MAAAEDANEIVFEPLSSRFQTKDGEAYIQYELKDGEQEGKGALDLKSTFVPPTKRGLGIAPKLAEAAFSYAKEQGLTVIPTCSFISGSFLSKNPHWKEFVTAAPVV
ncbi:hypothetical protein O6H91_16G042100 [Diphasiastrum complanatum]|uniref:Uncharacterized protein n=2 Tax=Diphasiastrum complanatum TaxID=34168 RepID=A0ACC2BCB7_DIPCM|nr:hypothetical protein O6H91_16G034400 [Diphasiastrum complanatum]KAJ7527204.1 hypothetical protein O6H91_16G042100 [Diphasiastrum complanatum]